MLKISEKFAKETKEESIQKRPKSRRFFIEHWLALAIVLIVFTRGANVFFQILG